MIDYDEYSDIVLQGLEDTEDGVCLQGQPLKTRIIPIYLCENDPRRIPEYLAVELLDEDDALSYNRKRLILPYPCLYRCAETDGEWRFEDVHREIPFDSSSISIEVIDLKEEELCVNHYILTSRKDAEDPGAQEFVYQVSDGEVTVTGVRHYGERLHIPAFFEGKPVTKIVMPYQDELRFLRELMIPDCVQYVDFFWDYVDLEVIQMPESTVLTNIPDLIGTGPWFENQPEGPVYFQNYYCGTKGMEDAKELIIRDGTVGSVRWTDSERTWDAITFPSSFRYVGEFSFFRSEGCALTIPEECTEVKAHFARHCCPKFDRYFRSETL